MRSLHVIANSVVFLCVLSSSIPAGAEVLTIERFVSMIRCADPRISPDGRSVLFTVSEPDLDTNKSKTDIWIMPLSGGEPRRFAGGRGGDWHPRWSPDGSRIAFVSTRGGSAQIWIIPAGGGEAERLTDISTGAHDPVWSPDGRSIAFYSFVNPDCPDDSCNAAREKAREENPVKARVIDNLLYRHWDTWKEGRRNHLFIADAQTGEFHDLTPLMDQDFPTFPWGGSGEYCFSPDGKEILVVSKDPKDEAISTNTDLYAIDLGTGEMRRLTGNPAADESPAFSPDGRLLAWRAQAVPGFESDRWRLMLMDWKKGTVRELTPAFDRWVTEYAWAPDSKRICFTAGDEGYVPIFSIDIGNGKITRLVEKGTSGSLSVSPDGREIVFVRRSWSYPHSIWKAPVKGGEPVRMTSFNGGVLGAVQMSDPEEVRYEGAGGLEIQAFVIKPPEFDPARKWPAIVMIHGGPQSAFVDSWYTNWNAQVFAAAGYVIFVPNFRGSDGFGQEFVNAISGDWGGGCYEDIMRGVDWLEEQPYVDPERIGAAGASYGGYMVNWIAGQTDRFAALVSMAGAFNLASKYGATEELWFPEWDIGGTPWDNPQGYEKWSPHTHAAEFRTPCLVVHGENDFRVPAGEGLQMFTALQRRGVPSRLLYFPDEGHWILKPRSNAFYYEQFIDWMDTYVKGR